MMQHEYDENDSIPIHLAVSSGGKTFALCSGLEMDPGRYDGLELFKGVKQCPACALQSELAARRKAYDPERGPAEARPAAEEVSGCSAP
jgi:hypothetical protein